MKSLTVGAASSCLTWFVVFGVISMCLCPAATFIGGFSSTLQAEGVAQFMEPYLCPANSSAEIITFQTTSRDEFGNDQPATGYEMQCVDANGNIVRAPSPDYAFYWVGLLAVGSIGAAGLLALLLAAPVGALAARFVNRTQKPNTA